MSKKFSQFPFRNTIGPVDDADRFLIGVIDPASPSGFSNYIMSWAEIKAAVGGGGGNTYNITNNVALAAIDGEDGQDAELIPGPRGNPGIPGTAGINGVDGKTIFMLPEEALEPEEPLLISGPRGSVGNDGKSIFMLPEYPDDPEDPILVKGDRGATGATGASGSGGAANFMLPEDSDEVDEPFIPYPQAFPDPDINRYAPGSFSIPAERYVIMHKNLTLTGSQTVTIAGTGSLRIT